MEIAAFATIEAEMGGRQKLVSVLSSAQLDANTQGVLGMIADPQHDKLSLAHVCALGNISLNRLMDIFKEAVLARGRLLAFTRIAARVPDVAAAVMEEAVPGRKPCPVCEGVKTFVPEPTVDIPNPSPQACTYCQGAGVIYHQPDHDVQKTALQIAGLLEKGGTKVTTIVANQRNGGGTDPGAYDKLIAALDTVVYGAGRDRLQRQADAAIDAEVADSPAEGAL